MVWYFLRQFLLAGIASICFGALRSTPWVGSHSDCINWWLGLDFLRCDLL